MEMYIFSILLSLSCQLSSRNSIFFITDLPHVHIRHYTIKVNHKEKHLLFLHLPWQTTGQCHRKAQEWIKFFTFRSQALHIGAVPQGTKNPQPNPSNPKKKISDHTALHSHWGSSPLYAFLTSQSFWQNYYMLPFWLLSSQRSCLCTPPVEVTLTPPVG